MKQLGFDSYIGREYQSPIITTFLYPEQGTFNFDDMYHYIKERICDLSGKLTELDTFRIGNIGEIYLEDINTLCTIIENYLKEHCNG